LTNLATFEWGCVGDAVAFGLVFALPELRKLWAANTGFPPLNRLAVALAIGVTFIALGGAAAVLVGDAKEAKHAIAYGLGFESTLGGFIKGAT